eukprot:TRINITY_DN28970_c0_g1_i1.p1 TRINITY_DN28970_c0_g1~~TRINITY_DN28970_c0_g1_i1.p1  ORF type:complete len:591 (-),score=132.25 TRINITY_DN28970_c0_g1_i1:32-1804(-)
MAETEEDVELAGRTVFPDGCDAGGCDPGPGDAPGAAARMAAAVGAGWLLEDLGAAMARCSGGSGSSASGARRFVSGAELRELWEEVRPSRSRSGFGSELHELALEYSWSELAGATASFDETRRLGSGACGTVYRGTLREGITVAVKLIEAQEPLGGGFDEEVRLLSRCRHPNVVMLLGFAEEASAEGGRHRGLFSAWTPQRRALVYELLPGGDAHVRLQARHSKAYLWTERFRTLLDVSRGLAHLHKHRPEIFHRDIKTANILFSADGVAKIADFGLACVPANRAARQLVVKLAAGTPGYADPSYSRTGVITEAAEIYSFGMVVLELLTARPPAVLGPDGRTCVMLCKELLVPADGAKQRVLHCLDASSQWPLQIAAGLTTLALLCVHADSERRPSFLEVVALLQELADEVSAAAAANSAEEVSTADAKREPAAEADCTPPQRPPHSPPDHLFAFQQERSPSPYAPRYVPILRHQSEMMQQHRAPQLPLRQAPLLQRQQPHSPMHRMNRVVPAVVIQESPLAAPAVRPPCSDSTWQYHQQQQAVVASRHPAPNNVANLMCSSGAARGTPLRAHAASPTLVPPMAVRDARR